MWDVHDPTIDGIQDTRQRAMVVPTSSDVLLGTGANEWVQILKQLVKGKSIFDAVNRNGTTNSNFKVLGNPDVTISSTK